MKTYKFSKEQLEFIFLMLDNYIKQYGLNSIYEVLALLKQLENNKNDGEFFEINLDEIHLKNLNIIFDVNLRTMGMKIFNELSLILSILENSLEISE